MLHRFEIHSALELSRTALLCCRFATSRLREADARMLGGNLSQLLNTLLYEVH